MVVLLPRTAIDVVVVRTLLVQFPREKNVSNRLFISDKIRNMCTTCKIVRIRNSTELTLMSSIIHWHFFVDFWKRTQKGKKLKESFPAK